jgi:translation initiation factor IF-1
MVNHGHTHKKAHNKSKGPQTFGEVKKDPSLNQEYARVTKALGDCRFLCTLFNKDSTEVKVTLPGRFMKGKNKQRVNDEDVVLIEGDVGLWVIVHIYSSAEVRKLQKEGELEEKGTDNKPSAIIFENEVVIPQVGEGEGLVDGDTVDNFKAPTSQFDDNFDAFISDI